MTAEYGGNTPCVLIELDAGFILILDGGTGMAALGDHLLRSPFGEGRGVGHVLVSHTHWAHIQGLPFFKPFLIAGNRFTLYGKGGANGPVRDLLRSQMSTTYCPVPDYFEDDVGAWVGTCEIHKDSMPIGGVTVHSRELNHVSGLVCLGYRLEGEGAAIAYLPDVEYLADDHRKPALALAHDADLLIHDAHFSDGEYEEHRGCGHSCARHAVEIARDARARHLLLYHHHPDHSDGDLAAIADRYQSESFQVETSREGAEFALGNAS